MYMLVVILTEITNSIRHIKHNENITYIHTIIKYISIYIKRLQVNEWCLEDPTRILSPLKALNYQHHSQSLNGSLENSWDVQMTTRKSANKNYSYWQLAFIYLHSNAPTLKHSFCFFGATLAWAICLRTQACRRDSQADRRCEVLRKRQGGLRASVCGQVPQFTNSAGALQQAGSPRAGAEVPQSPSALKKRTCRGPRALPAPGASPPVHRGYLVVVQPRLQDLVQLARQRVVSLCGGHACPFAEAIRCPWGRNCQHLPSALRHSRPGTSPAPSALRRSRPLPHKQWKHCAGAHPPA